MAKFAGNTKMGRDGPEWCEHFVFGLLFPSSLQSSLGFSSSPPSIGRWELLGWGLGNWGQQCDDGAMELSAGREKWGRGGGCGLGQWSMGGKRATPNHFPVSHCPQRCHTLPRRGRPLPTPCRSPPCAVTDRRRGQWVLGATGLWWVLPASTAVDDTHKSSQNPSPSNWLVLGSVVPASE